ncbi:myelin regulatory factor-like protein [Diadema setosum]|uniref:myelin regulatory factor-like protein n=1 Tax=Diadema setosum TaxID=31175 RepID=UPI003B3BCFB2
MDVLGENEAIQQILNQGIDLDQLESFLTESDASLGLSDITNDGSLGLIHSGQGPAGQLLPPKSQPIPCMTDNGVSVFENLGFSSEGDLDGLPTVPMSHIPDSPPDSGSEPYSPPDNKLDQCLSHYQGGGFNSQGMQGQGVVSQEHPLTNISRSSVLGNPQQQQPQQQQQVPMVTTIPHSSAIPTPMITQASLPVPSDHTLPLNGIPVPAGLGLPAGMAPSAPAQVPVTLGVSSISAGVPQTAPQQFTNFLADSQTTAVTSSLSQVPMRETINTTLTRKDSLIGHTQKKRRHSISPENTINQNMLNKLMQVKQEPVDPSPCPLSNEGDYNSNLGSEYIYDQPAGDGLPYTDAVYQFLKWQPYQTNKWHKIMDANGQEITTLSYRVEADKGFNFSIPDDAFVCQKKNHFQVTVHLCVNGQPRLVETESGLKAADNFCIHVHGIKVEAMNSYIRVEQSQADRSKKPFVPAKIDIIPDNVVKATIGRLHFSETTSNNMRKKGKPNPDQRYFMLVVSIQAHVGNEIYTVASQVSERIIVRASNPGQFESDVDVFWQKGSNQDSIFHNGRIGINTERPDEALVVNGNLKVTGHVMQPSDKRAKEDFQELDPREQLKNIGKMRVMRYRYIPAFAEQAGLPPCDQLETGVIAQEVMEVLPDAVQKTGTVHLPNGAKIEHFLVVNKDRIYMENVGAVKELVRLTDNLETRIDELEKMNQKLSKLKRIDSLKSNTSIGTLSRNGSNKSKGSTKGKSSGSGKNGSSCEKGKGQQDVGYCLSPRSMQMLIVALVLIMLFCFAAIATLYIMERNNNLPQTDVLTTVTSSLTATLKASTTGGSSTAKKDIDPGVPVVTPSVCTGDGCKVYCCDVSSLSNLPMEISNIPTLNSTYKPSVVLPVVQPFAEVSSDTVTSASSRTVSGGSAPSSGEPGDMPARGNVSAGMESDLDSVAIQSRRRRHLATLLRNKRMTKVDVDVTSIVLDDTQSVVADCASPSGNGNYSCGITVPPHFPVKFTQLELNTTGVSVMVLCSWTSGSSCLEQIESPESASATFSTGFSHTWDMPVGVFQNSSYTFRIMPLSEVQTYDCTQDSSLIGMDFMEYSFNFDRDLSLCPA